MVNLWGRGRAISTSCTSEQLIGSFHLLRKKQKSIKLKILVVLYGELKGNQCLEVAEAQKVDWIEPRIGYVCVSERERQRERERERERERKRERI